MKWRLSRSKSIVWIAHSNPQGSPNLADRGVAEQRVDHWPGGDGPLARASVKGAERRLPAVLVALLLQFRKPLQMGARIGRVEGKPLRSRFVIGDEAVEPDDDPLPLIQLMLHT